jgi:hypothetical protein
MNIDQWPIFQDGSFRGFYVLRGLHMQLPGMISSAEFERHKAVAVRFAFPDGLDKIPGLMPSALAYRIESQSSDLAIDSRRIVRLAFVASNIRVEGAESRARL